MQTFNLRKESSSALALYREHRSHSHPILAILYPNPFQGRLGLGCPSWSVAVVQAEVEVTVSQLLITASLCTSLKQRVRPAVPAWLSINPAPPGWHVCTRQARDQLCQGTWREGKPWQEQQTAEVRNHFSLHNSASEEDVWPHSAFSWNIPETLRVRAASVLCQGSTWGPTTMWVFS